MTSLGTTHDYPKGEEDIRKKMIIDTDVSQHPVIYRNPSKRKLINFEMPFSKTLYTA